MSLNNWCLDMAFVYRIVLVDDSDVVREALRWMLENEADFQIVGEAVDGQSGLHIIESTRPDAIILDIELPDQDGYSVAEAILTGRTVTPAPYIVFLSVHDDATTRQRCLQLGAGFAAKNAGWAVLITEMRKVLPLRSDGRGSTGGDQGGHSDDMNDSALFMRV